MITLNDFTSKRRLSEKAKAREEAELEQEVKAIKSGWGESEETESVVESFLDRCAGRYLAIAKEAKKMLPYKF